MWHTTRHTARHQTRAHVTRQSVQACAIDPQCAAGHADMQFFHRGHELEEFCGIHPAMLERHSHRKCKAHVRAREGKAANAAAGCASRPPWRCSNISAAIACHLTCLGICCRRSGSRARSELLDCVGHETWAGAHSSSASKAILEGAGQGAHDAAPPRACAAPIWPPRRPPSPCATVGRFP